MEKRGAVGNGEHENSFFIIIIRYHFIEIVSDDSSSRLSCWVYKCKKWCTIPQFPCAMFEIRLQTIAWITLNKMKMFLNLQVHSEI